MKKFGLLFASALALLALAACEEKEETKPDDQNTTYDDSYYAAQATVTSSDANFTANGNGGSVNFKAEGGSVTLSVNCGCEWLAENSASDLFTTNVTSTSLTVTAGQNTVEEDLTGTITLMTANQRITFATVTVNQTAYGAPEITVETTEWNAPAVGALTTEIAVEASADWTAESADSWLTVTKTDSSITLTATENGETTEKSTKVTLTCTDGIRTEYEYIAVSQDGLSYITLSDENVSFGSEEGSATVMVESNFDWDYSYDTSNGWLTVTRNGDVLTVTASANDSGDDREETITFTAGDGAENATEAQLTIIQAASTENNMIFTYTISSANTTTKLPLSGTVNCTVDWGDGSAVETVTSVEPSHTYATAGEYDITISGTVTALNSNNISYSGSANTTLTAVKQWGNTGLTDMYGAFRNCSRLTSLPTTTGDALSKVTSFYSTFYGCSALADIPEDIFSGSPEVTTFQFCFAGCEKLVTIPATLFANCSKVTTFQGAFYDCYALTALPKGLFDGCPLVLDFHDLCSDCVSLKTIPAGLFDNCTEVTDFHYVFYDNAITEIPKGLFDSCTKVENFYSAFCGCSSITEIPEGLFDSFIETTNFFGVFSQCTSLKSVPEGLFDKCAKAENFQSAFYNCNSLTSIPTNIFSKNLNVTNFSRAFYDCSSMTCESPYTEVEADGEKVKVHLYERANYTSELGCVAPTTYGYCFTNSSFTDLNSIPSAWGGNGD